MSDSRLNIAEHRRSVRGLQIFLGAVLVCMLVIMILALLDISIPGLNLQVGFLTLVFVTIFLVCFLVYLDVRIANAFENEVDQHTYVISELQERNELLAKFSQPDVDRVLKSLASEYQTSRIAIAKSNEQFRKLGLEEYIDTNRFLREEELKRCNAFCRASHVLSLAGFEVHSSYEEYLSKPRRHAIDMVH